MINRLHWPVFRMTVLAPCLRPQVNDPMTDRKTRADIRREILAKLTVRMRNLAISNS